MCHASRGVYHAGGSGMLRAMTTEKDPRALLVLSFDSPLQAQEALLAATRLQTNGVVTLHDAVFIQKDESGETNVTETVDVTPGDAALRGSFWGALLGTVVGGPVGTLVGGAISASVGALAAKLIDIGIPDETVKELEEAVSPGVTALALLVSDIKEEEFLEEMKRFAGARLLQSTLSPATVQQLRNALRRDA
jgi:uncharacterized membrane protein